MIIRPATLSDLAALKPCVPRRVFSMLVQQFIHSAAVAVERDGNVLAAGGLFPQGTHWELWFMASEGLRGSRDAYAVVRLLHTALHAVPVDQVIVAHVQRGNETGLRFGKIAGFIIEAGDEDSPWLRLSLATRHPRLLSPPQCERHAEDSRHGGSS